MVIFFMSSDEYDDENSFLMIENDPKNRITMESILERLTRCLVGNDYGDAEYWDQRYNESPEEYEWFMSWKYVFPAIQQYIKPNSIALNEGCGNSPMPLEMLQNGFSEVYNIDISSVLIEQMKFKYKNNSNLKWYTMDCTELTFDDNYFDYVVDKGTIDALYCSSDSLQLISKTVKEVERVLKFGGFYFIISFGDLKSRSFIIQFKSENLFFYKSLQIKNPRNEDVTNYIYILRKQA